MKIIYTKHAEDKLKRSDIRKFAITKKVLESILMESKTPSKTKYGDSSRVSSLDSKHDLRIIYDTINSVLKIITFHVSRKGRYK